MRKLISFKRAAQLSLFLFGLFILFHLSVIMGIVFFNYVPVDFLWGGKMETREQLLGFEIISLFVMVLCCIIVLIKSEWIRIPKLKGAAGIALWILVVLFALNTIGNIYAKTTFEKSLAIITVMLAILCLRLALGKDIQNES
jgi:hypothetical protein